MTKRQEEVKQIEVDLPSGELLASWRRKFKFEAPAPLKQKPEEIKISLAEAKEVMIKLKKAFRQERAQDKELLKQEISAMAETIRELENRLEAEATAKQSPQPIAKEPTNEKELEIPTAKATEEKAEVEVMKEEEPPAEEKPRQLPFGRTKLFRIGSN